MDGWASLRLDEPTASRFAGRLGRSPFQHTFNPCYQNHTINQPSAPTGQINNTLDRRDCPRVDCSLMTGGPGFYPFTPPYTSIFAPAWAYYRHRHLLFQSVIKAPDLAFSEQSESISSPPVAQDAIQAKPSALSRRRAVIRRTGRWRRPVLQSYL